MTPSTPTPSPAAIRAAELRQLAQMLRDDASNSEHYGFSESARINRLCAEACQHQADYPDAIEILKLWLDSVSTTPSMSGKINVQRVSYERLNRAVLATNKLLAAVRGDGMAGEKK